MINLLKSIARALLDKSLAPDDLVTLVTEFITVIDKRPYEQLEL